MQRQAYISKYSQRQASPIKKNFSPRASKVVKKAVPKEKENQSKIDMFKSSNFSFIQFMHRSKQMQSHVSQSSKAHSQVSTPRLTPLRMFERNRANDKMDMDRLE